MTESSEDISPYATFQLSEAPTLAHPGPTNTLLHSFMYHERAMTEGCASPPPQVLRQLHNQSPYYNIVRLNFYPYFNIGYKFSKLVVKLLVISIFQHSSLWCLKRTLFKVCNFIYFFINSIRVQKVNDDIQERILKVKNLTQIKTVSHQVVQNLQIKLNKS